MSTARHFGLFCIQGTGHLLPMAAIGRALRARGHRVTCFQNVRARAIIRAAGLEFQAIGPSTIGATTVPAGRGPVRRAVVTRDLMWRHAETILAEGCSAIERAGVDALVVDQADFAAGSVADRLGLPFVSVSFFPPLLLTSDIPPSIVGWGVRRGALARMQNWAANRVLTWVLAPILETVNARRRAWGLRPFAGLNDLCSTRALISQLPECLDFPRRHRPPHLHYAGPLLDDQARYPLPFPWTALSGAPLLYASMGTVRNTSIEVFRQIAAVCEGLAVQPVISLGGGLEPEALGDLPGRPIVVHYAPQLELLRQAAAAITHAGLNTTLESLSNGVPMVALPITDDQPGVAARIERAGAGIVIPIRKLTPARLRGALDAILTNPRYRAAAMRIQEQIRRLNGPAHAARIIEAACA
jgi:UDP:flavonoid glycosyltransferase YjiC (YdhE family)